MAEQTTDKDNDAASGELRGQLVRRLAVAGVLVATLLGVLAFFDYLANPPEEAEQAVFTQPVPVAPKKEVSQPVKPAENLPEPPAPEKAAPVAETPPPPSVAVSEAAYSVLSGLRDDDVETPADYEAELQAMRARGLDAICAICGDPKRLSRPKSAGSRPRWARSRGISPCSITKPLSAPSAAIAAKTATISPASGLTSVPKKVA